MTQNIDQEAEAKAKADAEAKAKAEADAANANATGDDDKSKSSSTIDYKAIAEAERKKRADLEALIAKNKIDSKRKKQTDVEDDEDADEDEKPLTRKDINLLIQTERQKIQTEVYGDRIKEIASELSESTDEADAIVEVHKSRTFPSHLTLREQLEEVHAIVNRKRIVSKNAEMARALKSKETASNDAASTYQDPQTGTAPKLSTADASAYKRAGFDYDAKDRVYKKKLPNGNFLIKDPKSKATYVRPK
jgi:hypothetical protein